MRSNSGDILSLIYCISYPYNVLSFSVPILRSSAMSQHWRNHGWAKSCTPYVTPMQPSTMALSWVWYIQHSAGEFQVHKILFDLMWFDLIWFDLTRSSSTIQVSLTVYLPFLFSFITRGREPWTLSNNTPDSAKTKPAKLFKEIIYPKPDGVLSFDLLTNLSRSGEW